MRVWKLVDGVSKPDFCHWSDSIDIQLEATHGFVYPDLVFEKIKRMPTEVTPMLLLKAIEEINIDHKKKLRAEKIIAEGGVPPELSTGSRDPWQEVVLSGSDLINPIDWDFTDKSRWMYTNIRSKLKTELHSKTIGIENKNGFEVYRLIRMSVDAVPENYQFYLDSQFTAMPQI